VVNIEFSKIFQVPIKRGNTGISKNFVARYIENTATAISNLTSKTAISTVKRGQTGPPWGGGWGVTADDDRGCYDPVLPRFTPRFTVDVKKVSVKFDVTVFEVKFVEVDVNFFRYNLPLS